MQQRCCSVKKICPCSELLVLSFAPRGFSPGTPVFPSPQKPAFPNSNSIRNQVDEEVLCACATSKSLFIIYLFIYFIIKCISTPSSELVECLTRSTCGQNPVFQVGPRIFKVQEIESKFLKGIKISSKYHMVPFWKIDQNYARNDNYAKNNAIKIYQSLMLLGFNMFFTCWYHHLVGPLFGSKGSRGCKGCQA